MPRCRSARFNPRLPSLCLVGVLALAVQPAEAQSLRGLFERAVSEAKKQNERETSGPAREAPDGAAGEEGARRSGAATALPPSAVADDSPAARDAALQRLRTAAHRASCADTATMGSVFGSSCNNREFPAPPILAAPNKTWETKPGWWGAWSPFLVGELMLTGSCNNDGNAGLSALDVRTGKTVWRIGEMCAVGNRRGSTGNVAFHELSSGKVLMIYPRDDGGPTDYYVIDVKAGRLAGSLKPAANVTLRGLGGVFTGVNQSFNDGVSNLIGFSADLGQVLWRNREFRLAMDKYDSHYQPTFSPTAMAGGVLFVTARSKDQPDPPTRQLHAIDTGTGRTLWRHTQQPKAEGAWRSDDGIPMVAGGKAVIRVQGLLGAVSEGRKPEGDALRAFHPRSGAVAWTTKPVPGTSIANYVAVGDTLVAEVESGGGRELWGFRLSDGSLAWRRPASKNTQVLASSGGAFYASERVPIPGREAGNFDYRLQGFDGQTGTQLWSTVLPGKYLLFDGGWGIVPDPRRDGVQGPAWRIGRDGAIYGVTLTGAYRMK